MSKRPQTIALSIILVVLIGGLGALIIFGGEQSEWDKSKSLVLPQLMPVENKDSLPLISTPLSDEIDIGFVIDREDTYDFINEETLEFWGVTLDELFEQALDNLDARSVGIDMEVGETIPDDPRGTYVILEMTDGYAAARLLSLSIRNAIAQELGEEYIAAIPTRDFLIFWHPEFSFHDEFIAQVQKEHELGGKYKLTPNPFLVNSLGIQALEAIEKE